MSIVETKLIAGRYKIPVKLEYNGSRIYVHFRYNKILLNEIRNFQGRKWHGYDAPSRKVWSIPNTPRNIFQLEYLQGKNPYAKYDIELPEIEVERPLYKHQKVMVAHGLAVHYGIWACEMGTGKTLAAIEVMERSGIQNFLWIGPKAGMQAIELELLKWKSKVWPKMMTYESLKKELENWSGAEVPFGGVIFDESAKIKSPTAQRSQAALHLANAIREEKKDKGFVILMSGSPAPKSPLDWWHQCIAEGTWILTRDGLRKIENIQKDDFIVVDGVRRKVTKTFNKGIKETYKIKTKEGYEVIATEDHRFLCDVEGLQMWRELKDLTIGDNICIHNSKTHFWEGVGSFGDGYLMGLLYGDGTVRKNKYGALQFFEHDYHLIECIRDFFPDKIEPSTSDGKRHVLQNSYLHKLIEDWGITSEKIINDDILQASSEFLKGFIGGFFDADGYVRKSTLLVGFNQSNYDRIKKIQFILNAFGIYSKIYLRKIRDIYINEKKVNTKDSYQLEITNESAIRFHEIIGFQHQDKNKVLQERISKRKNKYDKFVATIESIESVGQKQVYDITVPVVNRFSVNGFIAHNCEVACPGFLKEGDIHKFKFGLGLYKEYTAVQGQTFQKLVSWWDDEKKCLDCGEFQEHQNHNLAEMHGDETHAFRKSVNEVSRLYKRMQGLVLVQFKKDCLDLPDKRYEMITVKPTDSTLRAASLITKTAPRAVTALILLRELSDGFQYENVPNGEQKCPRCRGTKFAKEMIEIEENKYEEVEMICPLCSGVGEIPKTLKEAKQIPCPKEDKLKELLEEHDEVGRIVIYAGFTGSVDRCVNICKNMGWSVVRVDGRGWYGQDEKGNLLPKNSLLRMFQEGKEEHPRVAFVGQPGAAGMALTLTASPTIVYYSNTFHGEDRIQSEDRIHRIGMDLNLGARIIDLIHLPTDLKVLDNIKKKRQLQSMSMGELERALKDETSISRN